VTDFRFEQGCPCGDTIKMSGYESHVKPQVSSWRKIHDKHANAIAKAIAEARSKHPTSYSWPWTTSTLTTAELPSTMTVNSPDKQE